MPNNFCFVFNSKFKPRERTARIHWTVRKSEHRRQTGHHSFQFKNSVQNLCMMLLFWCSIVLQWILFIYIFSVRCIFRMVTYIEFYERTVNQWTQKQKHSLKQSSTFNYCNQSIQSKRFGARISVLCNAWNECDKKNVPNGCSGCHFR